MAVWLTFDMLLPTLDFGRRGDQGAWAGWLGRYFFNHDQFGGLWYGWNQILQYVSSAQMYVVCDGVLVC